MTRSKPLAFLVRPWRGMPLVAVSAAVWLAGTLYCMGYEALASGRLQWPGSLLWSAHAVMPWFALYEWVKRSESLPMRTVALAVIVALAGSLVLEALLDQIMDSDAASFGLQLMRRLPAIAAFAILFALIKATSAGATGKVAAHEEAEVWLTSHAASLDRLLAADNYLEAYSGGQIRMLRLTMKRAQELLGPLGFIRIHRSHIVARDAVLELSRNSRPMTITMSDGTCLPVGARYLAAIDAQRELVPSPQSD